MDSKTKTIVLILMTIGLIITTIYFWDNGIYIPASLVLGVPIILGFIAIILLADALRLRTPQIIFNEGHYSIRPQDIKSIPWQESTDDPKKKSIYCESLAVCLTGGIQAGELNLKGPRDAPVLIFPDVFLTGKWGGYDCEGHLDRTPFNLLPLYVQDYLTDLNETGGITSQETRHRIDYDSTPFFYGNTSMIDGSLTPTNAMIERKNKRLNQEAGFYEHQQNRYISSQQKYKDYDKKEYIVATPVKSKSDEDDA